MPNKKKKHQKLSSQIAKPLSITEISPNSIHAHVSRPDQYIILAYIKLSSQK